ncbi:MAG: porin family protein [Legionellales bacterium]|nr:porin family protein [Legionellales bacterium]
MKHYSGKWLIGGVITCLSCSIAYSLQSNNSLKQVEETQLVIGLEGGVITAKGGKTQTLSLAPNIEKTFNATPKWRALTQAGLFLGVQLPSSQRWFNQIGLDFTLAHHATLRGNIWDDADPQFNNYDYSYKIKHSSVSVKWKLLADLGWKVIPWLSASVGIANNQAYGFNNTPTLDQAVAMPNFTEQRKTGVTYSLGIGLQYSISPQVQMGVGYEFSDWGKSQLSNAPGQTVNSGLYLSHLYTHAILLNITYLDSGIRG